MKHKYDNTVILSQGGEHGKKIIEWWKKQGVDTGNNSGVSKGVFYGLIEGIFAPHTEYELQRFNVKIIELPEDDTSPQIIDLTDVEGVEMMVSLDETNWNIDKVIAKLGKGYLLKDGYFVFAKPIEYTYLTLQDISEGKGVGVDPKLIRIKQD